MFISRVATHLSLLCRGTVNEDNSVYSPSMLTCTSDSTSPTLESQLEEFLIPRNRSVSPQKSWLYLGPLLEEGEGSFLRRRVLEGRRKNNQVTGLKKAPEGWNTPKIFNKQSKVSERLKSTD
uniref:Uncharacterized protein n=1 Tax=Hucho hucho TaxID=62062 RepID=A0A4W5MLJ3_9TELE